MVIIGHTWSLYGHNRTLHPHPNISGNDWRMYFRPSFFDSLDHNPADPVQTPPTLK